MLEPPRCRLILTPTPLHRLDRASDRLGLDLWIKRDDLTGFALGGNKGRKLEYLIADALNSGADTVITCGSCQSNFVRQLGAACAMEGLDCTAVTMALPYEFAPPEGIKVGCKNGNSRLNELFGVNLRQIADGTWEELYAKTDEVEEELTARGKTVYKIPIGGSSHLGAYAFVKAAEELKCQGEHFDWIVACTSSGSTQTGLTHGFRDTDTKILGISADPEPAMIDDLIELSGRLSHFMGLAPIAKNDFRVNLDFCGAGYGVSDHETSLAIEWTARTEGILLDPIYTGKAFRGLLELAKQGELSGRILFWHTGGVPTLFSI